MEFFKILEIEAWSGDVVATRPEIYDDGFEAADQCDMLNEWALENDCVHYYELKRKVVSEEDYDLQWL